MVESRAAGRKYVCVPLLTVDTVAMGKRDRIGIVILFITVVWIVVHQLSYQKEPVYQGQPLSAWLERYPDGFSNHSEMIAFFQTEKPRVDSAIRGIGPKAVPTLVRMLRAKDSMIWIKVIAFVENHSQLKVKYTRAEARHNRASFAFQALGPDATDAAPEVIKIYDRNISRSSFIGAAHALAAIGPAAEGAIPLVMQMLTNFDADLRHTAIWTLGGIHCQPHLVVPALEPFLSDASLTVRLDAVLALEQFGTNAQGAIPALASLVDHPYPIGPVAARALGKINPEASGKASIEWIPDR
jgi:hypothetical protein